MLIGHRVPISSVVECHRSCWMHVLKIVRVDKDIRCMLFIERIVLLIVIWDALVFSIGSGNVSPFSVDLSHLCRSFSVVINTAIKMYISHKILLINEVHRVKERNRLLQIMTKIWHKMNTRKTRDDYKFLENRVSVKNSSFDQLRNSFLYFYWSLNSWNKSIFPDVPHTSLRMFIISSYYSLIEFCPF